MPKNWNCVYNHHPLCKGPVCDCKCHTEPANPLPGSRAPTAAPAGPCKMPWYAGA